MVFRQLVRMGLLDFHMQILKAHMVFPSMEKAMRVMVTRSMVMRITTIMMSMKKKAMMNMRVKEFLQPLNQINLILEVLTILTGSLLILLITSSEILTIHLQNSMQKRSMKKKSMKMKIMTSMKVMGMKKAQPLSQMMLQKQA